MKKITTNESRHLNIHVYGLPASGKSYMITTYTKGPILLLQTEPGICVPLTVPSFREGVERGVHTVMAVESWGDLDKIRYPIHSGFQRWVESQGLEMPSLVVVDSLTCAADLAASWVLETYPTKDAVSKLQHFHYLQQQHYPPLSEIVTQFVAALIAAPCATLFISQCAQWETETPTGLSQLWLPVLPGKLRTRLIHRFDWVFYARQKTRNTFELVTESSAEFVAKSRGVLLDRTIPSNLDMLFDLWETMDMKGGPDKTQLKNGTQERGK